MDTARHVSAADSVWRGEAVEPAGRQDDRLTSDGRALDTVPGEDILDEEGNLTDPGGAPYGVERSCLTEELVSPEDTVTFTETLRNMEWTSDQDGNALSIPRHLQMQHPPRPGAAKSSGYILEHKHLRRVGESTPDPASTSVLSPTYCSKCKKMFATSDAYGRHEPMHMLHIKLFPCVECGKYYRHNTALVIHRRTHTGEKPYCCGECGRRFNARSSLVTHGKIHSGKKLYSCSECGKGFAKTDDLFNHQLMHYRERKYTCGDCGKCFEVESELLTHRNNHPAEELFLCSGCGKDFTQYSKLLRHQKTHPKPPPVFITSEKMLKDQDA